MTTKKIKTKEDEELYKSLKGFVEKIIAETSEDKFSEEEIKTIIGDILPDIDRMIERKIEERLGDINEKISRLVLTHLNFLSDRTSDHIKKILNSLNEGG